MKQGFKFGIGFACACAIVRGVEDILARALESQKEAIVEKTVEKINNLIYGEDGPKYRGSVTRVDYSREDDNVL
jgi:hypothetical protein